MFSAMVRGYNQDFYKAKRLLTHGRGEVLVRQRNLSELLAPASNPSMHMRSIIWKRDIDIQL